MDNKMFSLKKEQQFMRTSRDNKTLIILEDSPLRLFTLRFLMIGSTRFFTPSDESIFKHQCKS